jgi:ATP-dependent DNA helicase RecG
LLRAEEAGQDVGPPQLSSLESPIGIDIADLDDVALLAYKSKLKLEEDIRSNVFHRRLLNQGLLVREGDLLKPTGYGILLFGKFPRDTVQQAGLKATVEYSNGNQDFKDFDGAMVLLPKQIEEWIGVVLKQTVSRGTMERSLHTDVPFDVIREAIVNALVHRDYDIKNAKIQLQISDDLIVIKSPGMPLSPITLEQMNNFSAPTLSRNPVLHYVFSQMDFAEERGLGMETWRSLSAKYGLPAPRFSIEDPYLVLTIYRNAEAIVARVPSETLKQLSESERDGWKMIADRRNLVSAAEYAKLKDISQKTAQRHLEKFIALELVESQGAGRNIKYRIKK